MFVCENRAAWARAACSMAADIVRQLNMLGMQLRFTMYGFFTESNSSRYCITKPQ